MCTVIDLLKVIDEDDRIRVYDNSGRVEHEGKARDVFNELSLGEMLTTVENIYYSKVFGCLMIRMEG